MTLVTSACGGSSKPSAAPTRPTTDASLQIAAPGPNAVTGRRVEMDMTLAGATLVPPTQTVGQLSPDRGHIHVTVDGNLVSMPARLQVELPVLKPGAHTVHAEFVALDHLPFANRVVAAVTFDVK